MQRLGQCQKLEPTARRSLQQSLEQLESAWANFESLPSTTADDLAGICTNVLDSLRQAADSLCPEIFKVEAETP